MDDDEDGGDVKDEKLWMKSYEKLWMMMKMVGMSRMKSYGWPEVVSVSGALPSQALCAQTGQHRERRQCRGLISEQFQKKGPFTDNFWGRINKFCWQFLGHQRSMLP